ncbi:hypothetical protein CSHOW_0843 [Campylobacter showae]|uniref:Uncharacterized protein n=1 Tax=Campylobacter showae RM3277 TaxID=553219 RepID=C6RFL9_9BACT|nr:hypothetical protein [Campylobacter showae]EET80027.1 hypothetical protein CAMSH0001_0525 [Campylobacter showae RM3277]QCD48784.1 hypothetical protein CSHOW_0843 [Campylobacter showae]
MHFWVAARNLLFMCRQGNLADLAAAFVYIFLGVERKFSKPIFERTNLNPQILTLYMRV